jgi:hypothetical protein
MSETKTPIRGVHSDVSNLGPAEDWPIEDFDFDFDEDFEQEVEERL